MNQKSFNTRRAGLRRSVLAAALAVGLGLSGGAAIAQSTTGQIYGSAQAADTVQVVGANGVSRTVTVNADGTYTIRGLPVGSYTIKLMQGGAVVSTHTASVSAGAGTEIDFASTQNAQQLGGVTVTANALPAIDVTTTHDSTTITATQLQKLPVARSMNAIALLTPGTTPSPSFGGVTFGGSSQAENAYYVNGYNTGEPYRNLSGFQLPYGAIAQQQTLAGAFGAKYGRSDGGVINQIGKSGTNEWHYGVHLVWQPETLVSDPKDLHYTFPGPSSTLANGDTIDPPWTRPDNIPGVGGVANYNQRDKGWETVYGAYIGGPLIKDKLFFFLDGEYTETGNDGISGFRAPNEFYTHSTSHETKYYGKINWNINDNNIFEFTALDQNATSGVGQRYEYFYDTHQQGAFTNDNNINHNNAKFYIGKYTSYLSDNATLEITYGKGEFTPVTDYSFPFTLPFVASPNNQTLSKTPDGVSVGNNQPNTTVSDPGSHLDTHGLRADFTYILGDHTLMAGIDNMKYRGDDQGVFMTGTGGALDPRTYQFLLNQASVLPGPPSVDNGLWVYRGSGTVLYENYSTLGGMDVRQRAWYLQDNWQITPNVLLNIGVRNDDYINYTGDGQAFVHEKNQWEPRVGASWDVFGDSSLKVYGNIGRYYLALPLNAANRAADRSTLIEGIFTYSGVDKNGVPIIIPGTDQALLPLFSPDGEYGNKKDVKLVVSQNLKPMYLDQINLGFDAKADLLDTTWTYGAKLSYRHTTNIIDDECDPSVIAAKAHDVLGIDPADYYNSLYVNGYCRLFNPGRTNTFAIRNDTTGEYKTVNVSFSDFGYPRKPVRNYKAINLYLAHPYDGTWSGRIDYTYTDAHGNTVGQVRPDLGQADVSKTEDWDNPTLMEGSYGELPNTRKHILRMRGTYYITPDWAVSLIGRIQSGQPTTCLGYYGPDATGDPAGYNQGGAGNYHYCLGQIIHPGQDSPLAGHTPWLHIYNLSVNWTPAFADHRLGIQMAVFNVLNEQHAVSYGVTRGGNSIIQSLDSQGRVYNPLFHAPLRESPRSFRFSISYDY